MKTNQVFILEPEEGKMLYNGRDYSDKVYTATDPEIWREVPMEQYEQWQREEQERLEQEIAEDGKEAEDETD